MIQRAASSRWKPQRSLSLLGSLLRGREKRLRRRHLAPNIGVAVEQLEDRTLLDASLPVETEQPQLLAPSGDTADATPTFSWTATSDVERYELLVKNLDTGVRVISQSQLHTTAFTPTADLADGNYRASIRAFKTDGTRTAFDSEDFKVSAPPSFVLDTPVPMSDKPEFTAPLGTTGDSTPTFQWTSVVDAVRYELLVKNLDTGVRVISQNQLAGTSFTPVDALADGNYRADVRAFKADGTRTTWSNIQITIDSSLSTQPLLQTPAGTTDDSTPTFSWTAAADVERYNLIVKNVDTGERVINESQLTTTSFTPAASLAPGNYRADIRAFKTDGTRTSWDSEFFLIQVNAPQPIQPQANGAGVWVAQGPGPTTAGQVESIPPNNPVVGAIHTVIAHPTNANILYIGAVNGGIWRTMNATAANPVWEPLTDDFPSLSIGAMEFDPANPNRILAGIGRFSSFSREGGALTGLLLSENGGNTWTEITDPLLLGKNISGVALRGTTLLATGNGLFGGGGLFRSTDNGATWVQISGLGGSGLPNGDIFDLVGDPNLPGRFYASMAGTGIFRSDDSGATWVNISQNDAGAGGVEQAIQTAGNNNIEMAVAPNGRLYVAVLVNGQANYIGFTNNGVTWTAMDLPRTQEGNGDVEGLNPTLNPGGQGAIHFSIVVDPNNSNIVYVAGDRQDSPFPNFIGAGDFSGRLFRGDTTVAPTGGVPSPQWEHLTHSDSIGAIPGGGTASSSAPHADSREMVFDANGNLIEVDDGGIYRRTSPADNTGDWFSLIGNLQVTEFHDIAYDTLSNVIIGGAQDTGTPQQTSEGSFQWTSVSTADGGDVAVDTTSSSGLSIRYSSFQNLGGFRRITYDASGNVVNVAFPALNVVSGSPLDPQFVTPVELNAIDATRLIIGGANGTYESFDQGETLSEVGAGISVNREDAIAYGGRLGGVNNPDVLYVGSGSEVFVRTSLAGPLAPTGFPGTFVHDIVLDPNDWRTAYVIDTNSVFVTNDAGNSWSDITGNLPALGSNNFRALEFIAGAGPVGAVVIGAGQGVFFTRTGNLGTWEELGTELPNAPVWDLDYDPIDDLLVAGTLGRGAWTLPDASAFAQGLLLNIGDVSRVEGNAGTTAFQFTVTLSDNPDSNVTVDFEAFDGTATLADNDFLPAMGMLVFVPNGPLSQTVTVNVVGDTQVEPDEFFQVALSNAVNATIDDGMGVGRIINDDLPSITISDVTVVESVAATVGLSDPILNLAGQGFNGVNPPDTVGDVGINHYIQATNDPQGTRFTIYNKADGSVALGPIILSTLADPGSPGEDGLGDPIVLYDQAADRWLLAEFSNPGVGNFINVYISQTADPTDNLWHYYSFETPNFPDYLKIGVWRDAYYVSTNEGTPAVYALDRTNMIAGNAARPIQRFTAPALAGFGFQAFTPADIDGATLSPLGAGNYFMRHRDDEVHNVAPNPANDFLEVWEFIVDFDTPANSSFTQVANIAVDEFDSDINGLFAFEAFPQPGTPILLDPLREVIMHRLAYRNFGTHETLVGNFVSDVDGTDHGGVRWFELRKVGAGPWTLFQEGEIAPDADNRWMGAIAMDGAGNIGVGYNITSSVTSPGIRYAGRLATDALDTMQPEKTLIDGTGFQNNNRWGDYSAMSIDPVDDTTFWFTGMYTDGSDNWATRIGTFSLAGAGGATFTLTLSDPSDVPVTVEYATQDFTALDGSDYVGESGTVTFAPGQTVATVTVEIIDDLIPEVPPIETFRVNLSNPANAVIADPLGIGTIIDDDDPNVAFVFIEDAQVIEGDPGDTVQMQFTVRLSQPAPAMGVTVDYATAQNSASENVDYVGAADTITFAEGETVQTITIDIIPDTLVEDDETFFVNLSNIVVVDPMSPVVVSFVNGLDDQAVGTILDDDAGTIQGTKFNDLNANGVRDVIPGTDPGIAIELAPIGPVVLPRNDDESTDAIDLGFTLDFYGQQFTEFFINNNGNVTFGGPLGDFTPDGFPTNFGLPMIAAFWADVDTNGEASGEVHLTSGTSQRGNPFVQVDWPAVGYFFQNTDLLNTFTLYIEDDPAGDIVAFVYGDMQWTTGDVDGVGGFGGEGAQIGFDAGDGVNFASFGRPNSPADLPNFANQTFAFRLDPSGVPQGVLEPGLEDVTIYIDINDNGVLDPGEPFTLTTVDNLNTPEDELGLFSFVDLATGTYIIREIVPAGFFQTTPEFAGNGSITVDLDPGETVTDLLFGNAPDTPRITITDVTQEEGDFGLTTFNFQVTVSAIGAFAEDVSVDFSTQEIFGSATEGIDYLPVSGTLVFPRAGGNLQTQTISVQVVGDRTFEPAEFFQVILSNAMGADAVIDDGAGLGTILNDDPEVNASFRIDVLDSTVIEGNGTLGIAFGPGTSAVSGGQTRDLAYTDFNGDGNVDLVTANGSSVSILLGDGAGNFIPAFSQAVTATAVATGDFNADGVQDVAFTDNVAGVVTIALLDEQLNIFTTSVAVGAGPISLLAVDIDNDGDLDLITANNASDDISVLVNFAGAGLFTELQRFSAGGSDPSFVTSFDFDGDFLPDLAVANTGSNTVTTFQNTGTGFVLLDTLAVGAQPMQIAAADFDGDFLDDLAVTNRGSNSVSILLSTPFGFQSAFSVPVGRKPSGIVAGDFDVDGDVDLAVANGNSDSISLLVNNSVGFFMPLATLATGDNPQRIVARDIDNDGDLDLSVANQGSGTVSTFVNNSNPTYFLFEIDAVNTFVDQNGLGRNASVDFSTFGFDAIGGVDFLDVERTLTFAPGQDPEIGAGIRRQFVAVPIVGDLIPEGSGLIVDEDGFFFGFGELLAGEISNPINGFISTPSGPTTTDSETVTIVDDDEIAGQSISGTKFIDNDGDGFRDVNLNSTAPEVVFVIDVSGTSLNELAANDFLGFPELVSPDFVTVDDVNNDGFHKTVLDAELATLISFVQSLNDAGVGSTSEIGVVLYGERGSVLDLDPFLAGVQTTNSATADRNGNQIPDIIDALKTVKVSQNNVGAVYTNYEAGLQTALDLVEARNMGGPGSNMIFLSDGLRNGGGTVGNEVEAIRARGINLRAFGVGSSAPLEDLREIDPEARRIVDVRDAFEFIVEQNAEFTDAGMPGVTIFLDLNGNGVLDADEPFTLTEDDDPATPDIDETGNYIFEDIDPGTYILREIVPTGFVPTFPAGGVYTNLVVGVNQQIRGADFGNRPLADIRVDINDVGIVEGDSGTRTAVFTVKLSQASGAPVTVGFNTSNGTATAGPDYVAQSGTLTFAPGETEKTISIVVNGDLTTEQNEVFFVNLVNATGAVIVDGRGRGMILDDEAGVFLQEDPRLENRIALFVAGTDSADIIELRSATGGFVEVIIDGANQGLFRPDESIYIYGKAGNDTITVSRLITYDTWVFAGDGDDFVETGSGNDLIVGGNGRDDIRGGFDGRDILIGGNGGDRIETSSTDNFIPQNNSNIAISGRTIYDDNFDALSAIFAEWTSPNRGFAERKANLSTGANRLPVLNATTIFDDGSVDTLFSYLADGEDWLFSGVGDSVQVV